MAELALKVKTRKTQEPPKILRQKGLIPAVLYGHKVKNLLLAVDEKEFGEVFIQAGESTIISLVIDQDKKPRKVLVKEVQKDPLTGGFLHIDFYQIKMTEKIEAVVGLRFRGKPPAVKELGGVLVKNLTELEVSCLPPDLPHEIIVPVENLKTFEDVIHIKDLEIPKKVEVLGVHPDDVVASVTPPRSEEELAALEEEVEEKVEEVEGVKEEEKEEEKGEEKESEETEAGIPEQEAPESQEENSKSKT